MSLSLPVQHICIGHEGLWGHLVTSSVKLLVKLPSPFLYRCSDRKPKLLSCLHSACSNCFYDQLAEARREDNCADVVDLDGDGIMAAPEVTCPICRSTTSEEDVIDNLFIQGGDSDPDDGADEDAQVR